MNIQAPRLRRSLTLAGALVALLVGFAAIQAAAAWTASAAPLAVTPVSAASIETRLLDEQARSADLRAQLQGLAADAGQLSAALAAAQARIDADAKHAAELEQDLKTAKRQLAALQRSIRRANAAAAAATPTSSPARPAATSSPGGDDGEDDDG